MTSSIKELKYLAFNFAGILIKTKHFFQALAKYNGSNIPSSTLCEKCPYSELFWSTFFRIWTDYGEILRISPYSVRMQEDADHNNSEYGHFLRNGNHHGMEINQILMETISFPFVFKINIILYTNIQKSQC